jgi:hypothetical protein
MGFRITLLEEDSGILNHIFKNISEAITAYCTSVNEQILAIV